MDINFSFSDIIRYWDSFTQYINPLAAIMWGIIGGIIGFIIVLITEFVLRKKILVRRRHWTLKWLSYLYMVFFPLFAGFCFTQWFALHNCEKQIVNNIPAYLGEANSAFDAYLKEEVEKIIDEKHLELTGNETIDKAMGMGSDALNRLLKEAEISENDLKEMAAAYLADKTAETEFVKQKAASYLKSKFGKTLLMDEAMIDELLGIKFRNMLDDGVLNTVIEKHVHNLFGSFKLNVIILFLLGIAIPIAEIFFAHYLERKRMSQESVTTVPPQPPMDENS